ncbi:MAG: hypothetical protein PHV36_00750 [Elusimicrobiales bacterium]|nr:hypothetical protein [Elusimicrobiales bacterium]
MELFPFKKISLALLLLGAPGSCCYCAAWTPIKLQVYGSIALPDADTVRGLSLGIVGNTENIHGLQLGFYNSALNVHGVQLGLVNICRNTLKGVQLGFANIGGRNAALPVTIGLNIGF